MLRSNAKRFSRIFAPTEQNSQSVTESEQAYAVSSVATGRLSLWIGVSWRKRFEETNEVEKCQQSSGNRKAEVQASSSSNASAFSGRDAAMSDQAEGTNGTRVRESRHKEASGGVDAGFIRIKSREACRVRGVVKTGGGGVGARM